MNVRNARPSDARVIAEGEWRVAATPGLLVSRPGEIPVEAFENKIADLAGSAHGLYVVAEEEKSVAGHLLLDPQTLQSVAHVCGLTICV